MDVFEVNGIKYIIKQINMQKIIEPYIQDSDEGQYNFDEEPKEIFFVGIPRELSDKELFVLFAAMGPILKFRLITNYYGMNRGFGYVKFLFNSHYEKALKFFRRRDWKIKAFPSTQKKRLLVGGVSYKNINSNTLIALKKLVNFKNGFIVERNGRLRILLEFRTHSDAILQRRKVTTLLSKLGRRVWVNWDDNLMF